MLRYHKNPITVNGDAGSMSGALWPARGGGGVTSLQPFPVTVSCNWPPASPQSVYLCAVCVFVCPLSSSGMASSSMGKDC